MVLCVRDFSGGLVAKILHSQYRGSGSIPGQGTRSRMLQQRLKILHGPTKIQHSQKIKIFFKKLKKKQVCTVKSTLPGAENNSGYCKEKSNHKATKNLQEAGELDKI